MNEIKLENKAIINLSIPINTEFFSKEIEEKCIEKFDAIYIPTLGNRISLINLVDEVSVYAEEIVVIFSGIVPKWIERIKAQNIIIISDINKVMPFSLLKMKQSSKNPSLIFMDNYDIPLKRNYALVRSKNKKYKTIGLIDDDIIFTSNDIVKAQKLLSYTADIVGFHVLDYPDVSTIDHVERFITCKPSKVSIGGNFLFFKVNEITGFFPYIYNEDWCFIFSNLLDGRKIYSAGLVKQLYHEPWKDHKRILFEQFGEIIISGFKKSIVDNNEIFNLSLTFWKKTQESYFKRLEILKNSTYDPELVLALQYAIKSAKSFTATELLNFVKYYKTELKDFFYV